MATKRIVILLIIICSVSFLAGCGGSSSSSSSNSPSAGVSIALNPAPASTTVAVGSSTGIQFKPVVSNDPTNAGVDWAITCSTPPCGSLNIPTLHSASGTTVTYLPPATLSGGNLSVNVTVFATADHTKNVTTAVTVNSYASVLKGTFVLQIKGSDSNALPYQSTGAFVFDGKGNVTTGEQILNTVFGFSASFTPQTGPAAPANTYYVGPDGRGTLILNLQQTNNTSNVIQETFSISVLSTSQALIAELDGNSGSGTLELQNTSAAAALPTGAYAFVTGGTDSAVTTNPTGGTPIPTSIGGIFNIDNNPNAGSISGNGSLADQDYYNKAGTATALESCVPPGVTGSVSTPDSLGAVTITLTGATCFGIQQPGTIQFTGFIVDSAHIRLIETDDLDGTGGFLTAGVAVGQGVSAGTFSVASLSGPYVFGVLGIDINAQFPSSFTSAGVVTADGAGNLTGVSDTFYPGLFAAFVDNRVSGTYSLDTSGIGRAFLKVTFKGPPPEPHGPMIFYLTGSSAPPLVLWNGGEDANFPALATGITYPQVPTASSFSLGNPETYGVGFTQTNGSENDGSGRVTSTVNGIAGALNGLVDDIFNNGFNGGSGPFTIVDSFTLPADSFGRIGGTFLNLPPTPGPFVEYYLVDDNHGFFVETDLLTTGQVGLGYFAQGCDVTSSTSCQAAASQASRRASFAQHNPHFQRGTAGASERRAK